jgi:predicted transcriptional regulator
MVTFIFVLIHANNGICKVYIRVFKVNEKNNLLKLIYVFFQSLQGIAFVEIENNSLKKKREEFNSVNMRKRWDGEG